jgi:2-keto-4-pentenoate hydratase/2-oxohepta-3-ene-1,7-dioic acid hydratase in catechol pathway
MKLITLKDANPTTGLEQLGWLDERGMIPFDFPGGMLGLIEAAPTGRVALQMAAGEAQPFEIERLAAPIMRPSKIIAIGRNYAEHVSESKSALPPRPLIFTKFSTAIIGPEAEITWDPTLTTQVDFEAELAVVIGRTARHVAEADALGYVFGYTCANDVSARDLQFGDQQWVRGKSLDTFCPLGPWLVTADEIADPQNLNIRCTVNGQTMQESNTRHMIFTVAHLISFCSQAFTLLPGDIILTGTPEGVGHYRQPPSYLQEGDEVAVEIEGVGKLVNRCRATTPKFA